MLPPCFTNALTSAALRSTIILLRCHGRPRRNLRVSNSPRQRRSKTMFSSFFCTSSHQPRLSVAYPAAYSSFHRVSNGIIFLCYQVTVFGAACQEGICAVVQKTRPLPLLLSACCIWAPFYVFSLCISYNLAPSFLCEIEKDKSLPIRPLWWYTETCRRSILQ